jgi:hypothetical protein
MSCLAPLGASTKRSTRCRRAVARSRLVDRRARSRGDSISTGRDFETALEQCDHTIELNPHFAPAYWIARRDPGAAQGLRRVGGGVPARRPSVAADAPHARRARAHRSRCRQAQACAGGLEKLETYAKERYVSPLEFAWIQFASERRRLRVSAGCTKAFDDRSFDLLAIKVDPRFDPLRDDERFRALFKQLGVE